MTDSERTRKELLAELEELRARVHRLEGLAGIQEAERPEGENEAVGQVLSAVPDLIFAFDREGRFSLYRASSDELYVPPEQFLGKKMSEVMPPAIAADFDRAFDEARKGGPSEFDYEIEIGGAPRWYSAKVSPMEAGGEFAGVVGVVRDITDRKRRELRLEAISREDPLTGLFDRRGFASIGPKMLELARRRTKRAVVLYVDVDNLKTVNDKLGHKEGDRLLRDSARVIQSSCRTSDVAARVGGDEFAILAM